MSKKGFEMYLKLSKNQERAPKVDKHSDRVKRADYSGDQPFKERTYEHIEAA